MSQTRNVSQDDRGPMMQRQPDVERPSNSRQRQGLRELGPAGKFCLVGGVGLAALWLEWNNANPDAWIIFPVAVGWAFLVIGIDSLAHRRNDSQSRSGQGNNDSHSPYGCTRGDSQSVSADASSSGETPTASAPWAPL